MIDIVRMNKNSHLGEREVVLGQRC